MVEYDKSDGRNASNSRPIGSSNAHLLQHAIRILNNNRLIRWVILWLHRCELRQDAQPFLSDAHVGVGVAAHAHGFFGI